MSEHGPTQPEHLNGSSPPITPKSEAIEALKAGESVSEVAKRFKLSESTVRYWKVTRTASSKRSEAERMLKAGVPGPRIRAKLGLSGSQLKAWRQALGIPGKVGRPPKQKGSRSRQRLDYLEACRPKAEEMFRAGASVRSVQAALGVSGNVVLRWRKGVKGIARKPKLKMGEWAKEVRRKMPKTAAEALALIPQPKTTPLQSELRRLVVRHGAVEIRKVLEEIESALLQE